MPTTTAELLDEAIKFYEDGKATTLPPELRQELEARLDYAVARAKEWEAIKGKIGWVEDKEDATTQV